MKTLSGDRFELQTLPAALINEGQVFLAEGGRWEESTRYLVQSTKHGLQWLFHYHGQPGSYGPMKDAGVAFQIDPTKGRGMDGVIRI